MEKLENETQDFIESIKTKSKLLVRRAYEENEVDELKEYASQIGNDIFEWEIKKINKYLGPKVRPNIPTLDMSTLGLDMSILGIPPKNHQVEKQEEEDNDFKNKLTEEKDRITIYVYTLHLKYIVEEIERIEEK